MIELSFEEAVYRWARHLQLPEEDVRTVLAFQHSRHTVDRDGFIVREGERPTSCHLLLSGAAFRQKVVNNGGRQIISFHFPGEFIDLQSCLLSVNDHSVQALTTCKLAAFPRHAMQALIDRQPRIAKALWLDTLIEGAIFREWVVNVGRRNAQARIAHLLCELALRLEAFDNERTVYRLPLTQEQIADATGLTAVHTNRVIQGLRRDGLISLSGGRLVVHDWEGLRRIGDFNELYLHLREGVPTDR